MTQKVRRTFSIVLFLLLGIASYSFLELQLGTISEVEAGDKRKRKSVAKVPKKIIVKVADVKFLRSNTILELAIKGLSTTTSPENAKHDGEPCYSSGGSSVTFGDGTERVCSSVDVEGIGRGEVCCDMTCEYTCVGGSSDSPGRFQGSCSNPTNCKFTPSGGGGSSILQFEDLTTY